MKLYLKQMCHIVLLIFQKLIISHNIITIYTRNAKVKIKLYEFVN